MSDPVEREQTQDSPGHRDGEEQLSVGLTALLGEMVRTTAEPLAPWLPAHPGEELGRFKLLRELGRGGFGVVFEAEDRELGRRVALKLIRPGSRIAERGPEWLQREAEALARLNHPNIVTLHDLGQGQTGAYLVFELLRGRHTRGFETAGEPERAFWGAPALTTGNRESPVAILYLVDTLRADHTTPYGYKRPTTPELAAFARDAEVIDNGRTERDVREALRLLLKHVERRDARGRD